MIFYLPRDILFGMRAYFEDRVVLVFNILAILINIGNWILLFFGIDPSEERIALHYNALFGVDFFGKANLIFRIPLVGLAVLAVHVSLGIAFYSKEKLATHVLVITAFFIQIFLVLASASLVYINSLYGSST